MEEIINVGFDNLVPTAKICSVLRSGSAPAKRLIKWAKEENKLIDATCGRKIKSVLCLDDDLIMLSSVSPITLGKRFVGNVSQLTQENW